MVTMTASDGYTTDSCDLKADKRFYETIKASVIVPVYNGSKTIVDCLRALLQQTIHHNVYEVIVTDDCSTDDTWTRIEEILPYSRNLYVFRHSKNRGQGAARNTGIRVARGEIVILVDGDIVVADNFVEEHINRHFCTYAGQRIAVMSNIRYADACIRGSNFGHYLQSRYLGFRHGKEKASLDYTNLPFRCFGGGISSMRREDIIAAGLFDEKIDAYGAEDEKLGYLLGSSGVRLVFAEEAHAIHYDKVSLERYKKKMAEISRGGYRNLLLTYPNYFEGTSTKYLLPINLRTDTAQRIIRKLTLNVILNAVFIYLLEKWAKATDNIVLLYSETLLRLLIAGWVRDGLHSKAASVKLVKYGSEQSE